MRRARAGAQCSTSSAAPDVVLTPEQGKNDCAAPDVVLTREQGKNDSVAAELTRRGVHVLELPLIEATTGPDRCSIY